METNTSKLSTNKTQQTNFTQTPNAILNSTELSLGAKGLWSYMAGKPEGWVFTIRLIASQCKESTRAITSKLDELINAGYVSRTTTMTRNGKVCHYSIFCEPRCQNANMQNASFQNASFQNSTLEYSNKYISKKDQSKKDKEIIKRKSFVKPTIDEIQDRCNEMGYLVNAEDFFNYYESKGWLVGKSPMKNWQAALAGWNSRDSKKNLAVVKSHNNDSLIGFKVWEKVMGVSQTETTANIDAATRLLKRYNEKELTLLILSLRECKKDKQADFRASHIANYCELEKNLDFLIDWARQKKLQLNLDIFSNAY